MKRESSSPNTVNGEKGILGNDDMDVVSSLCVITETSAEGENSPVTSVRPTLDAANSSVSSNMRKKRRINTSVEGKALVNSILGLASLVPARTVTGVLRGG